MENTVTGFSFSKCQSLGQHDKAFQSLTQNRYSMQIISSDFPDRHTCSGPLMQKHQKPEGQHNNQAASISRRNSTMAGPYLSQIRIHPIAMYLYIFFITIHIKSTKSGNNMFLPYLCLLKQMLPEWMSLRPVKGHLISC